jgi:glycosyltransferase involved in cell wall biosynthesis
MKARMPSMKVVVFTPSLVLGDAVSTDVLCMVDALERAGHRAYAAARWLRDGIKGLTIDRLPEVLATPDDVLIYHHSIGLEEAVRLYERLPCRKIIKYHNVTPPHFFQAYNKEVMRGCAQGLEQLGRLLPSCTACWADSDFNGRDMQARQPDQPYDVLPPFNQVESLIDAEPDLTTVALYDDWHTNILVVGRIVPNKNNLLAVDAFAEYHARHDPHSRLILAGDVAQNKYCEQVIARIRDHRLSRHVVITGKIAPRQLKTLFLTAQMLLTTSSHEGFCLPLVEAMGLRVPIVAVPATAIPGTAGDVAWYAGPTAEELASVMGQVRSSPLEREGRLNRGWVRYQEIFHNKIIQRRFLELFESATVAPALAVR